MLWGEIVSFALLSGRPSQKKKKENHRKKGGGRGSKGNQRRFRVSWLP